MIISKKKYELMCSLIIKQRETIKLLEEQTKLLKNILKNRMYGSTYSSDIDFPNSEKNYEDKIY